MNNLAILFIPLILSTTIELIISLCNLVFLFREHIFFHRDVEWSYLVVLRMKTVWMTLTKLIWNHRTFHRKDKYLDIPRTIEADIIYKCFRLHNDRIVMITLEGCAIDKFHAFSRCKHQYQVTDQYHKLGLVFIPV